MELFEVEETLTGWNVIRKCPVCKNSFVFVHNSRDKDRAIKAVNLKFDEVHLQCNFISAGESSAV
jgi:hypothetical protein